MLKINYDSTAYTFILYFYGQLENKLGIYNNHDNCIVLEQMLEGRGQWAHHFWPWT